jgi:broad specificity phosphatase PhoE
MNKELFTVYLAQHGETEWSLSGQLVGTTDLPLTSYGEHSACRLRGRLHELSFARVFTSPLQRTRKACELAGYGGAAELDPDLVEWDYGQYEGLWAAEIRAERTDWDLFRHGCPGGEDPKQATAWADRVIARVKSIPGNVLLFTCGQFI